MLTLASFSGGTQRLPRNVGRKAAIELILTGRKFGAAEALELGLVNQVVPGEQVLATALALATTISQKPSVAVTAALRAIHRGMDASIDDGLAIEQAAFYGIVNDPEVREYVDAFVEKRQPRVSELGSSKI